MRGTGVLGVAASAVIAIGGCQVGFDDVERGERDGADAGVPDPVVDAGDDPGGADAGVSDGGNVTPADAGPLLEYSAFAEVLRASCDDLSASYAATLLDGNGDPLTGIVCAWTFSDGGTSDQCQGTHVFAEAGLVGGTVVITHPPTGIVTEVEALQDVLHDPVAIDLDLSAPACGLTIDYAVSVSGGGGVTMVTTVVEPVTDVLGQDIFALEETVAVAAPGTYTVRTEVEDDSAGLLCTYQEAREVTVVACQEDCPEDGKTR